MIVIPSKRLEQKQRIQQNCPDCKGRGCPTCLRQLVVIDRFAEANLPVSYWFLKLKDYPGPVATKQAVFQYIQQLPENLAAGRGMILAGSYGTGKTSALCALLKAAIFQNYSAYYTTLTDLVTYTLDNETREEYTHRIQSREFLAVDEIDARHFSTSDEAQKLVGSNFEKLIRYRQQNNLPTFLATNNASLEEAFTGQYRRVVESLVAANPALAVLGKDCRKGPK